MRIHVTTLGARPHAHTFDIREPVGLPWAEVFVVCPPRFPHLADLDLLWQQRETMLPRAAQATFFRIHPGDESAFLPDEHGTRAGVELLHRRARMPLYALLWGDDGHRISPLSHDAEEELSPEQLAFMLSAIREAELRTYASQRHAWFPASQAFHYLGPNGLHYSSYLRVATALQGADELDGVAFWLLPFVDKETAVVLDTNTVSVVGLHLGQYLRETQLDDRKQIVLVQPMRGYDDRAQDTTQRRIEEALPDRARRRHCLVLISIVGSGELALRGRQIAEDLHFESTTTVGLYSGPDVASTRRSGRLDAILCPLPQSVGRSSSDDCPDCSRKPRGSSPALTIARDSYMLHVAQAIAATELNVRVIRQAVAFMGRYPGSEAFTVHRDEPSIGLSRRPRHHGIYIDVGRLADHPAFEASFAAQVDELAQRIDAVLAPEHEVAKLLGARAADRLGVPLIVRNSENLSQLTVEERALLDQPRLAIVDDAIITGERLLGYREALLAGGFAPDDVHAVVGVLRPDSSNSREGIVNLVHEIGRGQRQVHAVEELVLPNLHNGRCSWCWEQHLLESHGRDMELISDLLINRADVLSRTDVGLTHNLFWGWESAAFPLGPGSVLGPESLTQAQLFTIVASGLQTLRSAGDLDHEFGPPISKVLRPEFWLEGRFYAPPITASILRAANPHDLTAPIAGHRYKSRINARFADRNSSNLRTEFLLAVAAGKLPLVDGVAGVLTEEDADDGIIALFSAQLPGLLGESSDG